MGYSKIYAPMDGTVVSISMREGQTLNAVQMAPTILRIADLETMTVEAEVSEADVGKLTRGMDVYFKTLGGAERRWTGKLRQILPTPVIENNVVFYTALFDVPNSDGSLLTDMTAQVFFVTEFARSVLRVPIAAVSFADTANPITGGKAQMPAMPRPGAQPAWSEVGQQRPYGMRQPGSARAAFVRVVNSEGDIEQRAIRLGVTSRVFAEVLSGLSLGDEVVAGIIDAPATSTGGPRPPFGAF